MENLTVTQLVKLSETLKKYIEAEEAKCDAILAELKKRGK